MALTAAQVARMRATVEDTFDKVATRRRYPLVRDRYNTQIRDTANPVDVAGIPIALWQNRGSEDVASRDQQTADFVGRVPVGTDVTGSDVMIVDGVPYEVIGPPLDARTHLRLHLRHAEG